MSSYLRISLHLFLILALTACIPSPDDSNTPNQSFVTLTLNGTAQTYRGDELDPFMRVTREQLGDGAISSVLTLSWEKFTASEDYENRLEIRFPGNDVTTHEQNDTGAAIIVMQLDMSSQFWDSRDCSTRLGGSFEPPLSVTISEFDPADGGRVKGSFYGVVCPDTNSNLTNQTIEGEFDVPYRNVQ